VGLFGDTHRHMLTYLFTDLHGTAHFRKRAESPVNKVVLRKCAKSCSKMLPQQPIISKAKLHKKLCNKFALNPLSHKLLMKLF